MEAGSLFDDDFIITSFHPVPCPHLKSARDCWHSEIKCDSEQENYSEVTRNWMNLHKGILTGRAPQLAQECRLEYGIDY